MTEKDLSQCRTSPDGGVPLCVAGTAADSLLCDYLRSKDRETYHLRDDWSTWSTVGAREDSVRRVWRLLSQSFVVHE